MGFVVDNVALGQFFYTNISVFPCQLSINRVTTAKPPTSRHVIDLQLKFISDRATL
jgi:hypothetical protein